MGTTANAQSGILNKIKSKVQEKIEGKSKSSETAREEEQTTANNDTESVRDTTPTKPDNDLAAYRQFGFVRGSNIIFQEAFEEDVIGDYPKRWNSDAGGEVVKLSKYPGNWLRGTETANHFADFLKVLPTNFTLEFDIISDAKNLYSDYTELELVLASTPKEKNFSAAKSKNDASGFSIDFDFFKSWLSYQNFFQYGSDSANASYMHIASPVNFDLGKFKFNGVPIHVSIVRQDSRLVLYVNTTRIFDVRNAFAKNTVLNNLLVKTYSQLEDGSTGGLYFSNIVLAETVSDTRKDLFIDGKYVTNAILFETNSDKLQPGSLSAITVVADYLKQNPTVKLKVIGHTDNVGEDLANMSLSSKRATTVVKELVEFHKIDASRLAADGKGETQPVSDNNTWEGRAKNRRVEFIKQ